MVKIVYTFYTNLNKLNVVCYRHFLPVSEKKGVMACLPGSFSTKAVTLTFLCKVLNARHLWKKKILEGFR